jgi:hypothetical protein
VDEELALGRLALADLDDLELERPRVELEPFLAVAEPNISGLPCSTKMTRSSRVFFSVIASKAPSLKMLQFW